MNPRPTLAELRAKVFKQSLGSGEIGNWLARRIGRPAALPGTWLAIRLGLSAHRITLCALIADLAGAAAIGSGTNVGFLSGVILLQLGYWLDHVDGQVARWNGSASLDGVYFDYLLHHAAALSLGFGLGQGLAFRSGDMRWSIAGFAIAMGWIFLSLHNDCRYKAFFQRLKRDGELFRLSSQPAETPSPPSAWPRRGIGALSWPAFKLCEPHAVLIALTLASFLLIFRPIYFWIFIKFYVLTMAILSPILALARSSRAISRGSIEADFARWFEPKDSREA
ncbi:MAG: hypothetical protein NVSMB14_02800 [Isosphaeraceae bacterium]